MREIYKIRLNNVRNIAETFTTQAEFADAIGKEPTQVSRLIGKNPTKNIGDEIANGIEISLGLNLNSLDRSNLSLDMQESDALFYVRLKSSCDDLGLPVRGRARALNQLLEANLSDKAIAKWLGNESFPTIPNLNKLAAVLSVSPAWLGFGSESNEASINIDPLMKPILMALTRNQINMTPKRVSALIGVIDTW
jgi:transcriptional regulator with XRE-family HTH domain